MSEPDHSPRRGARLTGYAFALAMLALVFLLYLQPDFMVALTQQLWACF